MKLFNYFQECFQRFHHFAMNRMIPLDEVKKDPLLYWRARILMAILFTGLALSFLALILTIPLLIREKLWGLAIMDGVAPVIAFSLAFGSLKYKIRALISLMLAYAIGLAVIVSVGPLSGGPAWLFTFAVLAGVLMGSRAAVFAIALNTATLSALAWLYSIGQFGQTFPFFNTWEAMVAAGINFTLLNVIAAVSISILLKGLVSSHHKEKIFFNSITDLIFIQDLDGRFTSVNQPVIDLFGYERDELIGAPASDFMKPEMKPFFKSEYLEKIKTEGFNDGVTSYFTKDGKKFYIEYRNSLVVPDDGEPYISGSGRDVTERILSQREIKRLQGQIVQSQKMEAIGLMAGGVAHDLNNILSGIVSYPELLLMDLTENSPLYKPIKTIQEAGKRASDVVADLLTMARGVATEKKGLNLNTIVNEYLESPEFLKLEKTHTFVHFTRDLAPGLLNMSGSPIHMKKVLMNLVINASEAIEGSGTVAISTLNRYLDEPLKGYEDVRKGEYVMLTVSDDGSGISPEDLGRIFEPFYTKKVMGRSGTGLGLAVVWNTAQDHNGYINIHSTEKGTVFELYFPVNRDAMPDEKEDSGLSDCQGHGETILVVDDEERQREIACGMLKRLGFSAQSVPSGEAAIEHVKERPVDLILLDMVMPKGINGRETYEAILKIHPAQKAIIASGYAKTEDVERSQALGAGHYIKKPYSLREIGFAVKSELEKPAR